MNTQIALERDRRHLPIQIEKHLVYQWQPIIGPDALAVLLFYMSLADEGRTAYASIRRIARHLGVSSITVQLSNKILEWAGLIVIRSGSQSSTNRYIIQRPQHVTPEILDNIRAAALADPVAKSRPTFLYRANRNQPKGLIDRLNDYQPFTFAGPAWYSPPRQNGNGSQQMLIPQTPPEPEPESELYSQLLQLRGMRRHDARRYMETLTETQIIGWLRYFASKEESGETIDNQSGYLHTAVSNGDVEPPPLLVKVSRQSCRQCGKPTEWQNGMCSSCMDALGIRY